MTLSKEELKKRIEDARRKMDDSIEKGEDYEKIYKESIALDKLIELYVVHDF